MGVWEYGGIGVLSYPLAVCTEPVQLNGSWYCESICDTFQAGYPRIERGCPVVLFNPWFGSQVHIGYRYDMTKLKWCQSKNVISRRHRLGAASRRTRRRHNAWPGNFKQLKAGVPTPSANILWNRYSVRSRRLVDFAGSAFVAWIIAGMNGTWCV